MFAHHFHQKYACTKHIYNHNPLIMQIALLQINHRRIQKNEKQDYLIIHEYIQKKFIFFHLSLLLSNNTQYSTINDWKAIWKEIDITFWQIAP